MKDSSIEQVSNLQNWTTELLSGLGLTGKLGNLFGVLINIVLLFLICWVFIVLSRRIIRAIVNPWIQKSKNKDLQIFKRRKSFEILAFLFPGFIIYSLLPYFFLVNAEVLRVLRLLTTIYIILIFVFAITQLLRALEYLGQHNKRFAKKPVSSYIQVLLILTYLICSVLIISILIGKSPMTIITAFSAGMAIVLLIFKDLILGLVASIQVSVNDMVRVGDWISVHNFNADGEIQEINLTSVKVRNWDYTIANIPTYALVSNGFRNVREMQDQGMRRLMHHLLIDINSIKEVDETFIESLRAKDLFQGDIKSLKWTDVKEYKFEQTTSITNLSLFRKYIEDYITDHPGINNFYMVVRQLQQEGNGLPIEIYAFVNSVSFKPLNHIQSDIFEHLFSVMDDFKLIPYQKPGSEDFEQISKGRL